MKQRLESRVVNVHDKPIAKPVSQAPYTPYQQLKNEQDEELRKSIHTVPEKREAPLVQATCLLNNTVLVCFYSVVNQLS